MNSIPASLVFSTLRWLGVVGVACVLAACGGGGEATTAPVGASGPSGPIESYAQTLAAEPPVTKRVAGTQAAVRRVAGPRIDLGLLPVVKQIDIAAAPRSGTRMRIGAARAVSETRDAPSMNALLAWEALSAGGQSASITFISPGARAVRLALRIESLPGVALVRVRSSAASGDFFEIPGRELLAAIDRNAAAGDTTPAGRTAWLPIVQGEEATLEIDLPPGVDPRSLRVSMAELSHLSMLPGDEALAASLSKNTRDIGSSGSCNLDATCSPEYDADSRSTAKMVYSDGRGSYLCTGTLMADRAASGTPYLLSANHCLSTQTEASSLTTYWLFRSATCNSRTPDTRSSTLFGGATLLYTALNTDTTLLRLNAAAPANAVFAGSTDQAITVGTGVAAVHHPSGDLAKLATGSMSYSAYCVPGGNLDCTQVASNGNFIAARWARGTTEGGSSGGALLATLGGKRYVVGQLLGGGASCANPSAPDFYGRFDIAWRDGLARWLDNAPVTTPVATARTSIFRFYNATTRSHFFALGAGERDFVIATYPQFRYEGPVFGAYGAAGTGLSGVGRFYNATTGAHFYTIDPAEIAGVKQNASFAFEGERWFASRVAAAGAAPVYRFFQPAVGNHFYTVSESEKEFVRLNDPNWRFEGVGFYAWPQ